MGDKVSAIKAMKAAGVPTVPGSNGQYATESRRSAFVSLINRFPPVIVKAAAVVVVCMRVGSQRRQPAKIH